MAVAHSGTRVQLPIPIRQATPEPFERGKCIGKPIASTTRRPDRAHGRDGLLLLGAGEEAGVVRMEQVQPRLPLRADFGLLGSRELHTASCVQDEGDHFQNGEHFNQPLLLEFS